MKLKDAQKVTGVSGINKVSDNTTTIQSTNGAVRPATKAEQRMWKLIEDSCEDD